MEPNARCQIHTQSAALRAVTMHKPPTAWCVAQLPLKTGGGYGRGEEGRKLGVKLSSILPSQTNGENIAGEALQLDAKYK